MRTISLIVMITLFVTLLANNKEHKVKEKYFATIDPIVVKSQKPLKKKVSNLEIKSFGNNNLKEALEYYEPMFKYISKNTNLPIEFIAGYWCYETGVGKSRLWLKAANPSGINSCKARTQSGTIWSLDDGGSTKAKFNSVLDAADGWIYVFNLPRYRNCKGEMNNLQRCKLFRNAGYHTHKDVNGRYYTIKLCKEFYEEIYNERKQLEMIGQISHRPKVFKQTGLSIENIDEYLSKGEEPEYSFFGKTVVPHWNSSFNPKDIVTCVEVPIYSHALNKHIWNKIEFSYV